MGTHNQVINTGAGTYLEAIAIDPVREHELDGVAVGRGVKKRGVGKAYVDGAGERRDGRVGDVRVMQGLGAGLDQQAINAVRRWQFAPATRKGQVVDVVVEVAVEFKLR